MRLIQVFKAAFAVAAMGAAVSCQQQVHTAPLTISLTVNRNILPADVTLLPMDTLPMNLVATPDGKYLIICGMGYRDGLWVVRTSDTQVTSRLDFANKSIPKQNPEGNDAETEKANAASPKTVGLYYGLAIVDGKIYAAQGAHDSVAVIAISSDGKLTEAGSISTRRHDFPAGLATDVHGHLFVSNNASGGGSVLYRYPGSVAIYDTATQKEIGRYAFTSDINTTNYLLAITATHDGSKVYVGSERDGLVHVLNTSDPTQPTLAASVVVGTHPVALLLNHDESRLFVANAQSDTVTMVDTATNKALGTVLLRPDVARGLPGVSPTALALSEDEQTLFVALSDMNAVGVVDVGSMQLRGMMPVGWYPSALHVQGSDRLMVVDAKGHVGRHPNTGYSPFVKPINRDPYILSVLLGDVESIPVPAEKVLAKNTAEVLSLDHLDELKKPQPDLPAKIGLKSGKIKHVFYVIKENRTYDQVLGDDPHGDGQADLAIFGKRITPNLHALTDRFTLLDNTYACGEVSGDGWVWSTQGIANEYVVRNIPYHYSDRGRTFDFEGENNGYITGGFPQTGPDGKPLSLDPAFKNGAPPITDVAGEPVHLWDMAKSAGLSYRNYGFFISTGSKAKAVVEEPEDYPTVAGLQPPGHDLQGVTDMDFRRFDLDYPDSEAPKIWFDRTGDPNCLFTKKEWGAHHAACRFDEWKTEFEEMLKQDATGNAVPALSLLRMPHDHTQGMTSKKHAPISEVADNDFGIGELVETISHSPIWESSAIFVIEDDAQAGPDHVDCHRTTCYVISPWIKRGSVDHEFHNTDSVLKTIEQLLGLPPMSQYDAIAKPIGNWDTKPSNNEPYTSILPPEDVIAAVNVPATNPATTEARLQRESDQMDFTRADVAPADELNQVIWKSVRGENSAMPLPRHSLISPAQGKSKDDDDDD